MSRILYLRSCSKINPHPPPKKKKKPSEFEESDIECIDKLEKSLCNAKIAEKKANKERFKQRK